MIREGAYLAALIGEYEGLLLKGPGSESRVDEDKSKLAAECLCRAADWSEQGAAEITRLATDYGAFMLRNALAVAIVLGREDGELGF